MPSTYTNNLGIELPGDGELDGVWGDVVNTNMSILDRAINGSVSISLTGTSSTLTTTDGTLSNGQYKLLVLAGSPSGTHTITIAPNDAAKIYFVYNTTAQSVIFTQGSGGNVTLAAGDSGVIYSNGAGATAAVVNLTDHFAMNSVKITGGSITGITDLAIADGGTGASDAATARANLGLGTMATQGAGAVAITGGTISGVTSIATTTGSFGLGAVGTPSITFTGDTDTGFWSPAANTLAASVAGVEGMRLVSTGMTVTGNVVGGSQTVAGTYVLRLHSGTADSVSLQRYSSGLSEVRNSAGALAIVANGADPVIISTTNTERMRVFATGGVSIGNTTDPGATNLSVTGAISVGNATTTRSNLGLAIGTNVQAYDAGLQSISGLTTAADTMIYTTALDTYTTTALTAAGRALLDDADAAAQRTTLGLAIGTNVQAYDAGLQSISGLVTAADTMIYTTALDTYTTTALTAAGRALLDDADAAAQRTTLGLAIGTNVQAWDANLDQIAALAPTADNFIVGNGSAWTLETPANALISLGVTATAAELNFVDGVTSAIQTQLDTKYDSTDLASQAEAQAGTDNTKLMTPLRTAEAIGASGTAVQPTAVTVVDFTSLPAGIQRLHIMFAAISTSGTSHLMVQIGDTTGFYATGYISVSSISTSFTGLSNTTGFAMQGQANATAAYSGMATLSRIATNNFTFSATLGSASPTATVCDSAGRLNMSTNDLDRVRITTVGGTDTFDAGTINISWEF